MKNKSLKEKSKLNDYHQKKNKVALEAVKQMLKHPLSLEQARKQTESFMRDQNSTRPEKD
jgi:hypothetical protein